MVIYHLISSSLDRFPLKSDGKHRRSTVINSRITSYRVVSQQFHQLRAGRTMFDIASAAAIVRVFCSAYLLSTCFLLSFTTCGWLIVTHLEDQDNHLTKWFT